MSKEKVIKSADKAQKHIEGAIRAVTDMRAGFCDLACGDTDYAASIKKSNAVLGSLHQAHSDGIDSLMDAPDVEIMPQFGGK